MRAITIALLLGCGGAALAQAPAPGVPSPSMPDPHQLFRSEPGNGSTRPQFKFRIPDGTRSSSAFQPPVLRPPKPTVDMDEGIIRRPPNGFVEQAPRPASPHNLYPDLKVLPIETAQLDLPDLKAEPIPITWPKARLEPIPTTCLACRITPISGLGTTPRH